MLELTKTAADNLVFQLSIDDSVYQRDPDGARTYHVQPAPIRDAAGNVTGYHTTLWVIAVTTPWAATTYII